MNINAQYHLILINYEILNKYVKLCGMAASPITTNNVTKNQMAKNSDIIIWQSFLVVTSILKTLSNFVVLLEQMTRKKKRKVT